MLPSRKEISDSKSVSQMCQHCSGPWSALSAAVGRPWVPQEHGPAPWVDPVAELEAGMLAAGGGPRLGAVVQGQKEPGPRSPRKTEEGVWRQVDGPPTCLAAFPSWPGAARMTRTHRASPSLGGMEECFPSACWVQEPSRKRTSDPIGPRTAGPGGPRRCCKLVNGPRLAHRGHPASPAPGKLCTARPHPPGQRPGLCGSDRQLPSGSGSLSFLGSEPTDGRCAGQTEEAMPRA